MKQIVALSVLLLSFFYPSFAQNPQPVIRNLVFEGGGVRGLAYAGALMELEESRLLDSIHRVAGTSAGAIAAALYAVGYSPSEILHLISDIRIKSFADGKWMFIGGTRRLIKNFGWYRGERFNRWMSQLIKAKTGKENITFRELYELSKTQSKFKQLYLTGTNLTLQRTDILCHETFPEMEVRTGVRISISIPFFFQAVIIDSRGKVCSGSGNSYRKGCVMVDGGVIANYPIHIFDYTKYLSSQGDSTPVVNAETIGIRLDERAQIEWDRKHGGLAPVEIHKIKDFTAAFYNIVLENINRQNLTEEDWERTIAISTGGIGPKIRKMRQEEKLLLVGNGRKGVREFLLMYPGN